MKNNLKEYGYNERNMLTKENRKKKIARRHFFQTVMTDMELWEEAENDRPVYVTAKLAEQLPEEIYLVSLFDDSRMVYLSEEDLFNRRNPLFGTSGLNQNEEIPHLLFENELR